MRKISKKRQKWPKFAKNDIEAVQFQGEDASLYHDDEGHMCAQILLTYNDTTFRPPFERVSLILSSVMAIGPPPYTRNDAYWLIVLPRALDILWPVTDLTKIVPSQPIVAGLME